MTLLLIAVLVNCCAPAVAQRATVGAIVGAIAGDAEPEKPIRLHFVAAEWSVVLEQLAAATGSTLVMDSSPPGRYSRLDHRYYSRSEAVRVLNESLHEDGFRILEKGAYLVVVKDKDLRPRYHRVPITGQSSPRFVSDRQPANRRVSHAAPVSDGSPKTESLVAQTFQVHSDPREIARQVFDAFVDQATWDSATAAKSRLVVFAGGSTGGAASTPRMVVDVRAPQNEITVWSPAGTNRATGQLVQLLDGLHQTPGAVRLLDAEPAERAALQALGPLLQRVAMLQQPDAVQPPATAGDEASPADQRIRELIGSLRGNVNVETIPDLGVITIQGQPDDVAAVTQLIRELRQLLGGQANRIHLHFLEHVSSESFTELLNSMYERLGQLNAGQETRAPTVDLVAIDKPNAVLILANEADLQSILQLAEQLDRPVDPATEFVILRLQNASATGMLQLLQDFYQERGGMGTRFRVTVDGRTNSLVVQSRPRDLAEIQSLVQQLDHDASGAVSQLKVIPLRYALAGEVAQVINQTLTGIGGGSTSSNSAVPPSAGTPQSPTPGPAGDAKSVILQFFAGQDAAAQVYFSGVVRDIRVNADDSANNLIVAAPKQSMPMMEALIARLDKPTAAVSDIKVFPLDNADAEVTAELLNGLFAVPAAEGAAGRSSAKPLRLSVDRRTNSILAAGAAEDLRVVEAILLRLDEVSDRQRRNTVYRLKNSSAEQMAASINQFLRSQRELAQLDSSLVNSAELLEREIIVVPEAINNSLLISATPRYYDEIIRIVDRLDEAPEQVVIQALLVEVELADTDEFGVELGFQDSVLFDRSVVDDLVTLTQTNTSPNGVQTTTEQVISQTSQPGFLFNNQQLGNNTAIQPNNLGGQGLSNFALGRINGDLGYGGLVLSASSEAISVLIRALAARRRIHILSRPQIRSLDNQLAQIQVGQQVPVVDGVTISGTGSANPVIRQDNAGIILSVTPRVRPDQTIVMEVLAEKSQFTGAGVPIFTDANTGNVVESPIKNITMAHTTVSVPDSQTIVLGGMITNTDTAEDRRVPWLGDIPIIGAAFRYEMNASVRRELLIFLTPRVVRTPHDSEFIKEVEMKRLHFMEGEAEEVHGPLRGIPETLLLGPPFEGSLLPLPEDAGQPAELLPHPGGGA